MRVLRTLFLIVAVVAGIAGIAMVVSPGSTDRYFSWPIGPEPVASTVGAFYIASAIVFGLAAIRDDWPGSPGPLHRRPRAHAPDSGRHREAP
jgi:hypothetical protein